MGWCTSGDVVIVVANHLTAVQKMAKQLPRAIGGRLRAEHVYEDRKEVEQAERGGHFDEEVEGRAQLHHGSLER